MAKNTLKKHNDSQIIQEIQINNEFHFFLDKAILKYWLNHKVKFIFLKGSDMFGGGGRER